LRNGPENLRYTDPHRAGTGALPATHAGCAHVNHAGQVKEQALRGHFDDTLLFGPLQILRGGVFEGTPLEDAAFAVADRADFPAVVTGDTGGELLQQAIQGQKVRLHFFEKLIPRLGPALDPCLDRFRPFSRLIQRLQVQTLQGGLPGLSPRKKTRTPISSHEKQLKISTLPGWKLAGLATPTKLGRPFRGLARAEHRFQELAARPRVGLGPFSVLGGFKGSHTIHADQKDPFTVPLVELDQLEKGPDLARPQQGPYLTSGILAGQTGRKYAPAYREHRRHGIHGEQLVRRSNQRLLHHGAVGKMLGDKQCIQDSLLKEPSAESAQRSCKVFLAIII
jgi:hypothetical protein